MCVSWVAEKYRGRKKPPSGSCSRMDGIWNSGQRQTAQAACDGVSVGSCTKSLCHAPFKDPVRTPLVSANLPVWS